MHPIHILDKKKTKQKHILDKKNNHYNFWGNWLIFWGIWGETGLILGIWGAKAKYFQVDEDFFRNLGRSMQYF